MKNTEDAMTLLAGKGASGRDFFTLAAQALSIGLGCRWAAIVRHDAAKDSADLLAFCADGSPLETFSYPLRETPCEEVYGATAQSLPQLFVADDIADRFPGDNMLKDMGARSYRGELFFDAEGQAGGHVFVMDDKAMPDCTEDRAFFRLVTQRVGAEFNRWRTELALQESQARLQHAAKLATLGYWVWDEVEDRASFCSDELARIFGYDSGAEYRDTLTSTECDVANIHPEDREKYRQTVRDALAENRGFECDYRILTCSGELRRVREVAEPQFGERGELLRTNGVIQDITETQKAEEGRRTSEQRLLDAIESITEGFALYDNEDHLIICNSRYKELYPGLAAQAQPGITFEALCRHAAQTGLISEAIDDEETWIRQRLETHRDPKGPFVQQQAEGHWIQIDERKTQDGGTVILFTDITGLKAKAQELAEAIKRKDEVLGELNAVLDSIEYGILFMDADLKIQLHNRAYREIWGLPESFFQGNPSFREDMAITRCTSLCDVAEDSWEEFLDAREAEILQATPASTEVRLTDGRILRNQCIALPDGGRMLTYFEITDLVEREEALRIAMEEAKVANLAKSQFLANMSHELRTPLNAILGYGELISDGIYGEVPERLIDVMERMEHNGRHLLGLINNVLDLSRIEAGQLGLHFDDYSLHDVIDTVIAASEPQAVEKGLSLKVEISGQLPIGHGDSQRIAQVLRNLIDNAIKFSDQGEVLLEASASDGIFLVTVTDKGPGIPASDQDMIFDSFRQVDGTRTRKRGGSGLGLAIARRMVELHGGRIWVTSRAGAGAAFSFTLPAKATETPENA